MRGRFITIEGGEGAGKSTIMRFVSDWLEEQGRTVVATREPGGTSLAEGLRAMVLDAETVGLSDTAELLLMFAARAQHLRELIEPELASGHDVICDRFTDATYAYQGGGRQLDPETIAALEAIVHPQLQPDLTLLLDLPVKQGLKRASKRSIPDRIEREGSEFFERVRNAYLQRAGQYPDRIVVIDASHRLSRVVTEVRRVLERRL